MSGQTPSKLTVCADYTEGRIRVLDPGRAAKATHSETRHHQEGGATGYFQTGTDRKGLDRRLLWGTELSHPENLKQCVC